MTVTDIIVEPPGSDEVVEPMRWFESPGPLELEIGCGKGGFLLSRAKTNPHLRLLGIEWANQFFRYAADRMARWGLTNVRLMRADAKVLVTRNLAAGSVSVLHLYHPDPWPKRRHHKRRLVDATFAEAVVRVLAPDGRWLIQSDHREYFEVMRDVAARTAGLREIPWRQSGVQPSDGWSGTNYEIKYTREGRAIYRTAFVRTQGGDAALEIRSGENRTETRAE